MYVADFMDRVIVQSTFVVALIALPVLAWVFARWNSLEHRALGVVSSISLLLYCVGMAYLRRGHSITDAVFGVACFIWIAVSIVTAYALCELRQRIYVYCHNRNVKSFLALTGTLAVVVLGIVAYIRLLQWILT